MISNVRRQERQTHESLPHRSIFLYGIQKVGKTTAAAGFPGVLMANFLGENGTVDLEHVDVIDYETPEDFAKILQAFKNEKHEYLSLSWDGMTNFVMHTAQRIQLKNNYRDVRLAYGEATEAILPLISQFNSLQGYYRVITGHARHETEYVDVDRLAQNNEVSGSWNGIPVKKIYPDLPPRVRNYLLGYLDAYGFCYRKATGERVVRWQPINPPIDQAFRYKPSGFRELEAGARFRIATTTNLSFTAIESAVIKESKKDE